MKNKIVLSYRFIILVYYLLAFLIVIMNINHLERVLIYSLILIILFGIVMSIYIMSIPKLLLKSEYIEKKTSLENQMKELVLSEKQSRKQRREQKKMFDIWEQFYNEKKLTEYMVESCVERVEVFSGKRLSIRLRYQDQFQQLESSMKKVRK